MKMMINLFRVLVNGIEDDDIGSLALPQEVFLPNMTNGHRLRSASKAMREPHSRLTPPALVLRPLVLCGSLDRVELREKGRRTDGPEKRNWTFT